MMNNKSVGILGGRSLVGKGLLKLLKEDGYQIFSFTREQMRPEKDVEWLKLKEPDFYNRQASGIDNIPFWISLTPIIITELYLNLFKSSNAKRIVVLSSTSRFTKKLSLDFEERELANKIMNAELKIQKWADQHSIEWVILRPTLIYGHAKDKNLTQMARFIRKWHFFPLLGKATGLRQPVHADDVAESARCALECPQAKSRAYTVSGGEVLPYHEMVARIFVKLDQKPRLISLPYSLFLFCFFIFRRFKKFDHLNIGMISRMNVDQNFDCNDARRDFNYNPRPFILGGDDIAL